MKIAIFSDCYLDLTGGIVTVINADKAELEKRGHTVYVFSSAYPRSREERAELATEHIYPVPSCRFFGRMFGKKVTPIARRPAIIERWILRNFPEIREFDAFYVHYEAGCSIAGLRLGRKLGVRTVQVMHGREDVGEEALIPRGLRTLVTTCLNWFHSWYLSHRVHVRRDDYLATTYARARMWSLMVNHANAADVVLTPSRHFAKKLKHYGVSKPLEVLPNALPDELFVSGLRPKSFRSAEQLRLIWHSRLSGEKRILPFLAALPRVIGNFRLDVYGTGPEETKAVKVFPRTGASKIVFHGGAHFQHVFGQIKDAHLDVLVSYGYDTFGMTLIEAAVNGVPSLIVDPELTEILPEGGYLLCAGPDTASMTEALNSLFISPEKIQEMSEILLDCRDNYQESKRVDKLEGIFGN